jgi:hypothetical protein
VCDKCGSKGHIKRVCRNKYSNKKLNFVECCLDSGDEEGKRLLFSIRTYKGEPLRERVLVNELPINFEVDTGSAVTAICDKLYRDHFASVPLSKVSTVLKGYNGEVIDTLGVIRLTFSYKSQTSIIKVYVVKNGGPPILGRDFISTFQLQMCSISENDLHTINQVATATDLTGMFSNQYPHLFSDKLGCCKDVVVHLNLKPDSKPVYFRARPLPFAIRGKVEAELDRLIQIGILQPVSYSDYASPIVPVLKQSGKVRICADFSVSLNKQLLVDKYPLPRIEELFSKLHGGQQFSKLDLSSAYNQLLLSEDSQQYTCINTHKGIFKHTRLCFGLASAPACFQRALETILAGLDICIFQDDILITGRTRSEHLQRLHEVFKRLQDAGLVLQKDKCSFFQDSVSYLGFDIDKSGLHKSPNKVKAMLEAKTPQNVTELKSFLGLVNYYRQFVKNTSSILSPLHNLLKKNTKWVWTSEHETAVSNIKHQLASDLTLAHFDPNAKLILTVDASPSGLGAILSQINEVGIEQPISFMSRSLSFAEKKYSQIHKEATAIVFGVKKFNHYLYGRDEPFILRTDHKPLLCIFRPDKGVPEVSANRLQRYALFLSAYNYRIEYVSSAHNTADFLSRSVNETSDTDAAATERDEGIDRAAYLHFIVDGDVPISIDDVCGATRADNILTQVSGYVMNGWPNKIRDSNLQPYYKCRLELSIERGCLVRGAKLIIPRALKNKILEELHRGHLGMNKMKADARLRFWWPGMAADIERRAAGCAECVRVRPAPPRAPLAPWPFPPEAFYRVHLDILGPAHGKYFLVMADAYSKWVECFDVSASYSSRAVIAKLCETMSRFGVFRKICTDNGTSFVSKDFEHFCNINGIEHITTPTYNPSSNGQAEIYVKQIKLALNKIISSGTQLRDVNVKIQEYLFMYRNSKHSSTNMSPAEVLFGHKIRSRLDLLYLTEPSLVSPLSDSAVADNVSRQQALQTKFYDGKRKVNFYNGETVLVKVYKNQKSFWTVGVIVKQIGKTIYIVKLNNDKTFKKHLDQLQKYKGEEISDEEQPTSEQTPLLSPSAEAHVSEPDTLQVVIRPSVPCPQLATDSLAGQTGSSQVAQSPVTGLGCDAGPSTPLAVESLESPPPMPVSDSSHSNTVEVPPPEEVSPGPDDDATQVISKVNTKPRRPFIFQDYF